MKNNFVKTNLRWAGGKSKMLKILDNYFPEKVDKYLEPFTGGGSVLLYIIQKYNPKNVISNDIDEKLINVLTRLNFNPGNLFSNDDCFFTPSFLNIIVFRSSKLKSINILKNIIK